MIFKLDDKACNQAAFFLTNLVNFLNLKMTVTSLTLTSAA